jgi:hypothetical protein
MKKTRAFFVSAMGVNELGRFNFTIREPIKDVISVCIKKVIINTFAGINNSPWYFMRTDVTSMTRDTCVINGSPTNISYIIPNQPYINGYPISNLESYKGETYNNPGDIRSIWFELLDSAGQIINPPDIGWSFAVEIEFQIQASI